MRISFGALLIGMLMCSRSCCAMDWAMSWFSGSSPAKEYREDAESREVKEEDGWAIVGGASSSASSLPPDEEQQKDEDLEEESDGEHEKKEGEVAIPETRDTQSKLEPIRPGPYFAAFMNPNTVQYLSQAGTQMLATYFGYPGPVIILNTLRGLRAAYNTFCATKAIES